MCNLIPSSVNIHEFSLQMLSFCKSNAVYKKINFSEFFLYFLEKRVKKLIAYNIAFCIDWIVKVIHQRHEQRLNSFLVCCCNPAACIVKPFRNVPCNALAICNSKDNSFLSL